MTARPLALKRAIGNLLNNALYYGKKVELSVCEQGGNIEIVVRDHGPGVPEEALASTERRRRVDEPHIRYLPIHEEDGIAPPTRRVVLAWRRSFTRYEAIAALRNAVYACPLPGVQRLSE